MNLHALYKLQVLESRMDQIVARLNGLKGGKETQQRLKDEYQRLKNKLEQDDAELKQNQKQQEDGNNEIMLIQMNKQTSEAIKFSRDTDTVKKLENIEKHIDHLNHQRTNMENELIKLLEDAETIEKDRMETIKKLNFIKKKYGSAKESVERECCQLEAAQAELQQEIERLLVTVEADALELYRKIRRQHSDAVVLLDGRKCSGCMVELPAMDYETVKAEKAAIRCENCGRLLYHGK